MSRSLVVTLSLVITASVLAAVPVTVQYTDDDNSPTLNMRLQRCSGSDTWTLHGLWPNWGSYCEGAAFNVKDLNSIMSEVRKRSADQ